MLDFKKKVDIKQVDEIKVENCPVCHAYVCHAYLMVDASTQKKSKWFSCSCGVVFNSTKPSKVYDMKYWEAGTKPDKGREAAFKYPVRLYAPLMEELIYGRRVLIVGRPNTHQEDALAERGWVPTIIDKNTAFETGGNLIASDFEHHQFPKDIKFNSIWMYHTLDCLSDPIGSLALCKDLLAEDGIIVLMGADTDFINTRSSSCFMHWKQDENYIMWNRKSLTRHLETLGFNVILARQNYEHRFPMWDDYHIIAQKKFF